MTKQIKLAMAAMLMIGTVGIQAQQTPAATDSRTMVSGSDSGGGQKATAKKKPGKRPARESAVETELRELREKQAAQQAQIDRLTQQLSDANAAKDAQAQAAQASAQQAQQAAQAAQAQAQTATSAAQRDSAAVQALSSNVSDLKTANAGLAATVKTTRQEVSDKLDSPTSIHYKGVTITPVAFFAFEGVYRQHSVNSDINTPFNSIPFPSANEGHVSELNFSGRQSRLGGLFEGQAGTVKLTGYAEMDFLGTGTSSNNNQSNSYVLRQRQIWGQAATQSGFTVTGGQMWSLVTEDRHGIDARTEIQPQTIDPQYLVGYSWTRQPEIRIQQRWGNYQGGAFSAAMSLEQAQITGFTANGTNPSQYFFGGLGQNAGLYNAAASSASCSTNTTTLATTCSTSNITTYANNVAPDVIVKFAYDNKAFHGEIGGLGRFLRDEYYPVLTYGGTASAPTYTYGTQYLNHTASAGGVFGSARGYFGKFAEVALQGMVGTGTGRYGSSQLADATLRPDETLEPIRNYHGLASIETHINPKFDVFMYYGGEYAQRTVYEAPAGNLIGYGPANLSDTGCYNLPAAPTSTIGNGGSTGSLSASSCGSPTRYIQEGMIGFQYRPIMSPKYGKLQYSATYQYIQRQLWSGVGSATTPTSPRAEDGMIHVQMRYYIP